jgi:FtsP/CotA-like multicopper oxidase with cupredoxin domain
MGGLAASAGFHSIARAQSPPAGGPDGNAPPRAILRLQRRNIVVNGKPASVYDIRQPDGTFGITTDVGKPFRVRVENGIDEPSLIHWHGLTPPWQQDGVPGISGPPIPPGGTADYDFPLRFGGTFWMHSHQGLQEQLLMAAPLIIHDQRDRPDQQEIVVMLADFSFTPPDQIFAELKKSGSKAQPAAQAGPPPVATKASMGGMAKMGASAKPDLNDVKYDAFLANDRTLADPEVIKVEPGGRVLLRIINSSSMSAYHIDLDPLDGELVAVDGFAVAPVKGRNFPIAVAQRLDIRLAIPRTPASHAVLAVLEGDRKQTGVILAAGNAPVARIPDLTKVALDGPHARSGRPPPRTTTADPAQGRPRSHDKPDRRYGEIHMVAQQRPLDPERPAIADRQWRTGRAGDGQSDWNAAPDASAWSRVPGRRDRRQTLLGGGA